MKKETKPEKKIEIKSEKKAEKKIETKSTKAAKSEDKPPVDNEKS